MKRQIGVSLLAVALLAAGTGCGKTPEPASTEAPPQTVTVAKAERTDLSNVLTFSGALAAKDELKLVPKGQGKVARINAEVGQRVNAGDMLLELDNADIQARLDAANAGVEVNKASLERARLQLDMDKIALDDAQRHYDRVKALFDAGATSQSDFDAAKSSLDTSTKRCASDEVSVASAQAQLNQSQAQVRQTQVDLENAVLRSPISGIVSARNVNVGEYVSNTATAFNVVRIDTVEVKADLTESDVNSVRPGQEVEVKVAAASDKPFKGRIAKVSPAADEKAKTFPIWIAVDNGDYILKPGMFAEFQLATAHKTNALTAPAEAVVMRSGAPILFVITDNKAVERKVKTGFSDGKRVEILDGLKDGEMMATGGQMTLADGAPVAIKEAQPATASPGADTGATAPKGQV
ncbi:efflux RND transporter periplasmic adaptor subunit [Heliobacterium gestii]|uniref:Efflux RND transporter periplasmic adaptor subunit n=1 Tax=Heliomicrobium gestii TaxID=2699 RepID=A0A845LDM8_HELGE|nr:efflux RND transporter periplasmic adaptor subunit [Heliomicrobium gestii]MBM7865935.1 RND family efflux transporter MFP subunit [Heliomicrobium gestii]MZP42729.1 efflux RND transporter periplasmic adaptor subunit [Heliomicrobium gestii]